MPEFRSPRTWPSATYPCLRAQRQGLLPAPRRRRPEPLREIPFRPSRVIHFFPPHNDEDGRQGARHRPDGRRAARQPRGRRCRWPTRRPPGPGWSRSRKTVDIGDTQLWTRVNSLDSPWGLDDLTAAGHRGRRQARRDHDPQGRGARGHPLRRPPARPARGEGRARPADPRPRHPRDGARRGQRRGDLRRLAAHAGPVARPGRPRRQPADEDHPRRRRPPRLPRPRRPRSGDDADERRAPRTSRTCGTTRSPAWSTPASTHGILPFYGPFGDIKDTVACEDQFRNAYLLGCVGAWSLHPVQIDIAKRVFSPRPGRRRPRPAGDRGDGRRHRRGACSTARWRTTPRSSSAR